MDYNTLNPFNLLGLQLPGLQQQLGGQSHAHNRGIQNVIGYSPDGRTLRDISTEYFSNLQFKQDILNSKILEISIHKHMQYLIAVLKGKERSQINKDFSAVRESYRRIREFFYGFKIRLREGYIKVDGACEQFRSNIEKINRTIEREL